MEITIGSCWRISFSISLLFALFLPWHLSPRKALGCVMPVGSNCAYWLSWVQLYSAGQVRSSYPGSPQIFNFSCFILFFSPTSLPFICHSSSVILCICFFYTSIFSTAGTKTSYIIPSSQQPCEICQAEAVWLAQSHLANFQSSQNSNLGLLDLNITL